VSLDSLPQARNPDAPGLSGLRAATTVLMGLRSEGAQVRALIERVQAMIFGIRGIEESWVYQDISSGVKRRSGKPVAIRRGYAGQALDGAWRQYLR
jgi:hypothetical protein